MRPVSPGGSGGSKALPWEVLQPPCGARAGRGGAGASPALPDLGSSTDPLGCCPCSCDPRAVAFEDVALHLTLGVGVAGPNCRNMACLVKDPTWVSPGAGRRVSAWGSCWECGRRIRGSLLLRVSRASDPGAHLSWKYVRKAETCLTQLPGRPGVRQDRQQLWPSSLNPRQLRGFA